MEQSEELFSTAALKQRGLRPKTGETPAKATPKNKRFG
jgi:hypothetical protein